MKCPERWVACLGKRHVTLRGPDADLIAHRPGGSGGIGFLRQAPALFFGLQPPALGLDLAKVQIGERPSPSGLWIAPEFTHRMADPPERITIRWQGGNSSSAPNAALASPPTI